jgi:hypothetical protein
MTPAARILVVALSFATLVALSLAVTGHALAAVLALLSPMMLVVAVFGVYGLLTLVAFVAGRVDALRHGPFAERSRDGQVTPIRLRDIVPRARTRP